MASGGTRLLKPISNRDDVTTMRRLTNRIVSARTWNWPSDRIAALQQEKDEARAPIVLRALISELPYGLTRATKAEMVMMIMGIPDYTGPVGYVPAEGDAEDEGVVEVVAGPDRAA